MDATRNAMHRAVQREATRFSVGDGQSAATKSVDASGSHRLPPTRAARPARSRGVFWAGRPSAGHGRWIRNIVGVAMIALSIAAGTRFIEPAFDAHAFRANAAAALLGLASRPPSFLIAHAR